MRLYRNEFMHQLSDDKLRGLIIEETGQDQDSAVVTMILSSIKAIKKFASWSETETPEVSKKGDMVSAMPPSAQGQLPLAGTSQKLGLNLSYTINLNLPATSDVAVFNAIFKSLRENLLEKSDGKDR